MILWERISLPPTQYKYGQTIRRAGFGANLLHFITSSVADQFLEPPVQALGENENRCINSFNVRPVAERSWTIDSAERTYPLSNMSASDDYLVTTPAG
jgi:hypothetical protein